MHFMRWALVGVIAVLVSCGGGSDPTSTEAGETTAYEVGDTGPGGGIIFYVDEIGLYNKNNSRILSVSCSLRSEVIKFFISIFNKLTIFEPRNAFGPKII